MSGIGYNALDPAFHGFEVQRDERPGVDVGARSVRRGVTIDRLHAEGHPHIKDESIGDVQPRMLWPNILSEREVPSYASVWAATVTATEKDRQSSSNQASGASGQQAQGFAAFGGNPFGSINNPNAGPLTGAQISGNPFGFLGAQPGAWRIAGAQIGGGRSAASPGGANATTGQRQATHAGGTGGPPMKVRPIRDRGNLPDERYMEIAAPDLPSWASRLPKNWTGAILCASKEERQEEVFLPAALGLVSALAHKSDPQLSTAVVDLDDKDKVDPSRRAVLNTFLRVVKGGGFLSSRGPAFGPNVLSWDIRSSLVTDADLGDGRRTVLRDDPIPVAHGRPGSVLDVGSSGCTHNALLDSDGNKIRPLHINRLAPFLFPGVGDGPLLLSPGEWPDPEPGDFTAPVYCVFDRDTALNSSLPGLRNEAGVWRWYCSMPSGTDDTPPPREPPWTTPRNPDPPQPPSTPDPPREPTPPFDPQLPDPVVRRKKKKKKRGRTDPDELIELIEKETRKKKRVVGGTTRDDTDRTLHLSSLEMAVPALVFKPHTFACGAEDLRNWPDGPRDAREEYRTKHPVIGRMEGAWRKSGADCNRGIPTYTHRPGSARYRGGTASGVLGIFPGEVGMEDAASSFAPGGISLSTLYLCALRGSVRFGGGLPDPTTGLIESGWHWGVTAAGALTFVSTTSAGADDKTVTMPSAQSVTLVGRAASGTENKLLRFDANGDAKDSAAVDDGTTITLGRATIQAGDAANATIKTTDGNTAYSLTLRGSDAASGNNNGGAATLRGGDGSENGGAGNGGNLTIRGGEGAGSGAGGNVTIRPGTDGFGGTKGTLALQDGDANARLTIGTDGAVATAGTWEHGGTHDFSGATVSGVGGYKALVAKAADETCDNAGGGSGNHASSGATMTADATLVASLASGVTYAFEVFANFTNHATPDLKLDINYTSTSSAFRQVAFRHAVGDSSVNGEETTTIGTDVVFTDGATNVSFVVRGYITTTGAGTLQFRWAQNTGSATQIALKAGSFLRVAEAS